MDEKNTIQLIEGLLDEVVKEESDLLKKGRVEGTFTTNLVSKLKPFFEKGSISVDASYNKHHDATKRLDKKCIELDIAIHERGRDDQNCVAIELETNNNPKRDDIWKLERLTQSLDGYGYRLGLFLVVGVQSRAGEIIELKWYKNGKIIKDVTCR